jgi:carboxyl-terminal processing protease
LDSKTGIKLTTALYYTPSGTSIQAKGIIPDITVDEVKIPKEIGTKKDLIGVSEADLNKHILNKNNPEVAVETKVSSIPTEDLLHEDYQLYSALTVLEGMALANR